ncbi:MAG: serine/threonine protein kinase [Anaeromyxobacter sp.]|nr:serine/threonine protein kinase [Anaeromyxobacter sp.]MBL0277430.1 serine/threonine protein kinase [Anaeromyxobacter sp.]
MADERRPGGEPPGAPGTLTRLIEDVVRGAPDPARGAAWTDGLRSGTVIGRYELLREVGRGGFGVVWEARDRELGRTVAFKALRVRGEASRERRLLAEAEVAARLSHPNIVTVLDVGRGEHGVHLVQEFLTGATLSKRLAEGRLPLREALRVAVALARGLAHAHAHGVVHRDLTPGNVQLCDDGQVKLLDLGMAAALGRRKLEGGTPAYMAPEQAEAAPEDERTDVYALGVLLYRMLAGVAPQEADAAGRARSASRGIEVAEAPALGALVEAMLARAPTERPRDAAVVLEALQEIQEALPRSTSGPSRVRVRPAPRVRWVTAGVAAGLAAAALIGLPAALWLRGGGPPAEAAAATVAPLVLAASSALLPCTWKQVHRVDFDTPVPGARWRNGEFKEQGLATRDGRGAWRQASDWNQLILPAGQRRPDVFAVEASFLAAPVTDHAVTVTLHAYGDPAGPIDHTSSDVVHGRGIVLLQAPGNPPRFEWGIPDGVNTRMVSAKGTLPAPFTGRWRTLRIEGSRSRCWLRASLDGQPLVIETGACDLEGGSFVLTAGGAAYVSADVLWREFRLSEGDSGCQ